MRRLLTLACVVGMLVLTVGGIQEHSVVPKAGFVPDERTAVRIAEAVLIPIYGEENIVRQRPFRAALADEVWTVEGTLPPGLAGGTALVRLSKKDGRILRVTHGR